ncbi:MAG TPA: acylphosphatase [Actinomycetota bacterium]|nr:acylphosphatase [Actinomycetota bacterium]
MEDRTRVHVFVSGDVQGVGFREAIAEKANEQNVTGWVRNLPDGRVEAVLEGPCDEVYRVVGLCRAGPKGANVTGVQVDREPPRQEKTFKMK